MSGSGFRVQGSGSMVHGLGFRVQGSVPAGPGTSYARFEGRCLKVQS